MLRGVSHFKESFDKYGSVFIFMDRLSLSDLSTVYRACGDELSNKIFTELSSRGFTFGYTKKHDFDSVLSIIAQVRNCVMHENSLTILIRYSNVKDKKLRLQTNRKRYSNVIKKLYSYGLETGRAPA